MLSLQNGLALSLIVFVVISLWALTVLWSGRGWFVHWLKGSLGFLLVGCVVFAVVSFTDLKTYWAVQPNSPLATVSIYELDEQEFDITIATLDGKEKRYIVFGDQWNLNVRVLHWKGPLSQMVSSSLYRLDEVSGRYLTLEQERTAKRSSYSLASSRLIDVWSFLQTFPVGFNASYENVAFMPLANGAVYSIQMAPNGMVAAPLNDVAEELHSRSW